jgi:putative spermidine/putrescine transport system permease protein
VALMAVTPYAAATDRAGRMALKVFAVLVFLFLLMPIAAVAPLSFNAGSFLSYPLAGTSLRWYREIFQSTEWMGAFRNSVIVASVTALISTPLGALAALGLVRLSPRLRAPVGALLLAPLIAPVIVTAVAAYFLYARIGLANSYAGLILAHTTLATPFVILVVQASLQNFDEILLRAALSLGASPVRTAFHVLAPLIAPGVFAGAVFAFMTSFDETVMAMFLAGPGQRTLPLQMFDGVRDQISPAITAAASLLTVTSVVLLAVAELIRRWGANLGRRAA